MNDRVYRLEEVRAPGSSALCNTVVQLTPGTYNSVQLAAELQTQLNAASVLANVGGGSYQYTCTVHDGRITVMHNIPNSLGRGYLYTKDYTDDAATYLTTTHAGYPRPHGLGYVSNQQDDSYIHNSSIIQS